MNLPLPVAALAAALALAVPLALRAPSAPPNAQEPTPASEPAPERVRWQPTVLVQLAVADLDRAIAFYRDVLDLELVERIDELRWAKVATAVGGVTIGLGEQETAAGSGTASINLGVSDLPAARALLERRGVRFDGPTLRIPGVVQLADFADPDGNKLRLAGADGG